LASCRNQTPEHTKTPRYSFKRGIIALHLGEKYANLPLPVFGEPWRMCCGYLANYRLLWSIVQYQPSSLLPYFSASLRIGPFCFQARWLTEPVFMFICVAVLLQMLVWFSFLMLSWEQHLRSDRFCVACDVKHSLSQSILLTCRCMPLLPVVIALCCLSVLAHH